MKVLKIFKRVVDFFKCLGEEIDKATAENHKWYLEFYEKHGYYPGHLDPFTKNSDFW